MTERDPEDQELQALLSTDAPETPAVVEQAIRDAASRLFEAQASPLEAGEQLGDYTIVRCLGRGGQATVYEARHTELERRVALKVPDAGVRRRLLREARLAAELEHPCIARVEDIRDEGETPFLVMELCTGGDLERVIERHPEGLPIARVRSIADRVLEALARAHAAGIIHRDIKPSNVLLDGNGMAKLADLGLGLGGAPANRAESTLVAATAGTPAYMAPELRAGAELDGRTDLYAFGKVLFTMLSGRPPVTIVPPSRLRDDVSPAVDDLLFALLESDPDDRPPDAETVHTELTAAWDAEAPAVALALPQPTRQVATILRRYQQAWTFGTPVMLGIVTVLALGQDAFELLPFLLLPPLLAAWASVGMLRAIRDRLPHRRRPLSTFGAHSLGGGAGLWIALEQWAGVAWANVTLGTLGFVATLLVPSAAWAAAAVRAMGGDEPKALTEREPESPPAIDGS